jgi:uncharacterized membrane protein
MKKSVHFIVVALLLVPLAYLMITWSGIPETVPLHWNINGEVDRYGSKNSLLLIILSIAGINGLVYLLLCNVHRIDPMKHAAENKGRLQKIGLALVIFMSALSVWIIYTTTKTEPMFSTKFLLISIGLLFSVIGNYMYNLKRNWFAGLRLPWTMSSEDNWKQTHNLASKLWFAGGLLIAFCGAVLPFKIAIVAIILVGAVLVIVPCVYSYKIYKQTSINQQ